MRRMWFEAAVMGCGIAVTVMVFQELLIDTYPPLRYAVLLLVGIGLCLVQYGVSRWRQ